MAPKNNPEIGPETEYVEEEEQIPLKTETDDPADDETIPPWEFNWPYTIGLVALHLGTLVSLYVFRWAHPLTWLWTLFAIIACNVSVTAGSHRLWTHRSYKAKLPLRILLATVNVAAGQHNIIEWSHDHRVHHKYSETNSDPHNAKRGFFFSHMGWLLLKKHPAVLEAYKKVGTADLYADPVARIQAKLYIPGMVFMGFIAPALIPWYFWGENIILAFFLGSILRYTTVLHTTWCVNSVAHLWGNQPYDKHINPAQSIFVSIGAVGEGWHNFHHTFPNDYAASELPWKVNLTTMFIDFMAAIGQVTDRKKIEPEVVKKRMLRTGDGSKGFATSDF